MAANATTLPGRASVANNVRLSSPPKTTVRRESFAVDLEAFDNDSVTVDDQHAMRDRRTHVEASVLVETETVTATAPEILDDPFVITAAGRIEAQQTRAFDHDDVAVGFERNPVDVPEAGGHDAHSLGR